MAKRNAAMLDKNFDIPDNINKDGLAFYDAESLDVYGVKLIDGKYRRMRAEDAEKVNSMILAISSESAGGRVRFATNSARIAIYAEYASVAKVPNYPFSATMGFDIYSDERFVGVFVPPFDATESYESIINTPFRDGKMHEYTVNFPICSEVVRLLIGVNEDATITAGAEYTEKNPVVYYGSSTTQGACASHPGCSYECMVSRAIGCDFVNLGFWGNAKGEEEMAKYIAGLNMSAFVYDYDYNAPSAEHLAATHEKMFRIIREAQPNLPIVIMTAPIPYLDDVTSLRAEIIYKTYKNALASGDGNVYFINGSEVLAPVRDASLTDNIHPGDIGFRAIADSLIPILKRILL